MMMLMMMMTTMMIIDDDHGRNDDDDDGKGETEGKEERTSILIHPNSRSPAPVARILLKRISIRLIKDFH